MSYFPQDNVGLWDKLTYSLGILGKNIAHGLIFVVVLVYCTQELRLRFSFLASSYLLSLLVECACALLLGLFFDHCKRKINKYKEWIIFGTVATIIASASFILLPKFILDLQSHHFVTLFICINCCFIFVQLPYLSLISSFSSNATTRNLIAIMPNTANFIGRQIIFVVLVGVISHSEFIKWEQNTYYYLIGIASIILIITQISFILCIRYHQTHWTSRVVRHHNIFKKNRIKLETNTRSFQQSQAQKQKPFDQQSAAQRYARIKKVNSLIYSTVSRDKTKDNDNEKSGETLGSLARAANQGHDLLTELAASTSNGVNLNPNELSKDLGQGKAQTLVRRYSGSGTSESKAPDLKTQAPDISSQNNAPKTSNPAQSVAKIAGDFELDINDQNASPKPAKQATVYDNGKAVSLLSPDAISASSNLKVKHYRHHNEPANLGLKFQNASAAYAAANLSQSIFAEPPEPNPEPIADISAKDDAIPRNTSQRYRSWSRYSSLQSHTESAKDSDNDHNYYQGDYHRPNNAENKLKFSHIAQVILKNDQLMIMFLIGVLQYTNFFIMSTLLLEYFIKQNYVHSCLSLCCVVLGLIGQVASMLFFPRLALESRRTKVFVISNILLCVAFMVHCILQYFDNEILFLLIPTLFLAFNVGMGLSKVAMTTMVADTVDYGEFKLSQRNDALVFAYFSISLRLGAFIAYSLLFSNDIEDVVYGSVSSSMLSIPVDTMFEVVVIIALLSLVLYMYKHHYKLNGAFYRNILNNLQFLRQNQRNYNLDTYIQKHFMLRYSLDVNAVIIKLKAHNEMELIQAMVQKLSEVHAISSEHDYMCDLKARLALGPCGIAEGIAIPHAKSSAVRRATVVVATLDHPIDLGALDGKECDLIFLLASPDDGVTHMNLLGRLSLLLNEPSFADKLRAAGSSTELFERLIKCEKNVVH